MILHGKNVYAGFLKNRNKHHLVSVRPKVGANLKSPEAEFKEFEPRLKFKPRLKYGWFHLKLYSMFQDLSRRSIETGFWRI